MTSFVDKLRDSRLKWFSHVMRRERSKAERMVMELNGKERRGKHRKIGGWMRYEKSCQVKV